MTDNPYEHEERPVVVARHRAWCGLCGYRILPDEEIVKVAGEWCHLDCAPDEPVSVAA